MGLLRLATVAAVGIALLPADKEQQAVLYERAAATTRWTITFCDRNELTCENASLVWTEFLKKAEFGAKLAYDVIQQDQAKTSTDQQVAPAIFDEPRSRSLERASVEERRSVQLEKAIVVRTTGTLTSDDMKPRWRGKLDQPKH